MWLTIERRSRSARSFGGLPWKVQPSWKAGPPAGTSMGTSSSSAPGGSQPGAELGGALGEHGRSDGAVGLPHVAELARAVGWRLARHVVDLVGLEAGLPLVPEAGGEALAQAFDLVVLQELLEDQHAVAAV